MDQSKSRYVLDYDAQPIHLPIPGQVCFWLGYGNEPRTKKTIKLVKIKSIVSKRIEDVDRVLFYEISFAALDDKPSTALIRVHYHVSKNGVFDYAPVFVRAIDTEHSIVQKVECEQQKVLVEAPSNETVCTPVDTPTGDEATPLPLLQAQNIVAYYDLRKQGLVEKDEWVVMHNQRLVCHSKDAEVIAKFFQHSNLQHCYVTKVFSEE